MRTTCLALSLALAAFLCLSPLPCLASGSSGPGKCIVKHKFEYGHRIVISCSKSGGNTVYCDYTPNDPNHRRFECYETTYHGKVASELCPEGSNCTKEYMMKWAKDRFCPTICNPPGSGG